jgi:ubiquinone/menaquinone biosynthesis C-methylase UbiE
MMSYNEFAEIYDIMMEDIPYEEWVDFIKKNISGSRILEIACGTGAVTRVLADENYRITAFDISEEMLVHAYEKLRKYPNVEILNMDMKNISINRKFDVALCCCDGINYLLDDNELIDFFKSVHEHLDDKGVFIFDYSTIYKLKNFLGNKTIVSEEDNIFMVWENEYDYEENTCEMDITFFIREDKGLYRRLNEHQMQKSYSIERLYSILENAGFSNIKNYSGYSFESSRSDDERTVIVCNKE